VSENSISAVVVSFSDVPTEKLAQIPDILWSVLRNVTEESLNMERMRSILHRKMLDFWATLESDPHSAVAYDMIGFMLYGNTSDDASIHYYEMHTKFYGSRSQNEMMISITT
jgi:hypothetical protein